jgi:hypothetical protein
VLSSEFLLIVICESRDGYLTIFRGSAPEYGHSPERLRTKKNAVLCFQNLAVILTPFAFIPVKMPDSLSWMAFTILSQQNTGRCAMPFHIGFSAVYQPKTSALSVL